MTNPPNIIIMSDREECLYGRRLLERLVRTGKTEPCKIVNGINLELYVAYLKTHFANHQVVRGLHSGSVTDLQGVRAISDQLVLTEADTDNLIHFQKSINPPNDEGEEWKS